MLSAEIIEAGPIPASPARTTRDEGPVLRVGVVQHAWDADSERLLGKLHDMVGAAAARGARIVFLPEITLVRYPADGLPTGAATDLAEDLETGPSVAFARRAAAAHDVYVHISVYRTDAGTDGLGSNTAVIVSPDGQIVAATDKLHIPVTAGYYEDHYFRPGAADGEPYPVHRIDALDGAAFGLPTCWDEWFPEVARSYSLGGANIVVYPTAIGSEPDHPDFDTRPLWQQVIVGNGIANGLFMVVPNRTGAETRPDGTPGNTFYGSSFVSDPYGRVLVQAPRDTEAVLVADLDLAQRQDWLDLFPLLRTRRPDTYARLTAPVDPDHPYGEPATALSAAPTR
ncbi:nitrilase-related carbon-nitrogen hydrolase [Microlunatus ginsengisoli]|uniref:Hydrolase n=1 Tax=Microlunatus ginsengisoli TaxID=363863 RepID=A0ABP7A499_9ACTN